MLLGSVERFLALKKATKDGRMAELLFQTGERLVYYGKKVRRRDLGRAASGERQWTIGTGIC